MQIVGLGDGTDDFADMVSQLDAECLRLFVLALERDKSSDCLAFHLIGATNDCGFRNGGVGDKRALDLGGPEAVTGNIEHIIKAADDPEVAFLVASRAVTRGVQTGIVGPVGLFIALFITVD